MSAKSVNDAIRRINGIINDIKVIRPKIELFAANTALKIILRRIFNKGKAADGSQIGEYDDKRKQKFLTKRAEKTLTKEQRIALAKKRLKIGRGNKKEFTGFTYKELRDFKNLQTDFVDLQFTGRLFESIQVVQLAGGLNGDPRHIVAITDKGRAEIAGFLEDKYGKPIFSLGTKERAEVMEKTSIFAQREISKIIKKWSK